MLPLDGVKTPAIIWSKVDLPLPFSPTKPTLLPDSIEKLTSFNA
jgi:hypothetical protein